MYQDPELNITKEIDDLLFTDVDCTPIWTPFLHRKLRRDPITNEKVVCPSCNSATSGIIEGKKSCPYCFGAGHLFDESIEKGFFYRRNYLRVGSQNLKFNSSVGRNINEQMSLVTNKSVLLQEEDTVYTFKLDAQGMIQVPIVLVSRFLVFYSREMTASGLNSDYNISVLGD